MQRSPFSISRHATGLTTLAVAAVALAACDQRGETTPEASAPAAVAVPTPPVVAVAPAAYGDVHDHGEMHAQAQPAADTQRTVSSGDATEVGAGELLTIERMMPEQVYANSENRFMLKASNNSDKILHNVVLHHAMVGDFQVVQTNTPSEVKVPQQATRNQKARLADVRAGLQPRRADARPEPGGHHRRPARGRG